LKGHGFSRAASWPSKNTALAAEGMQVFENTFPQGLKPNSFPALYGAAEAAPFQNSPERDSFWTGSKSLLLTFPRVALGANFSQFEERRIWSIFERRVTTKWGKLAPALRVAAQIGSYFVEILDCGPATAVGFRLV
jgi:hypothetical protein